MKMCKQVLVAAVLFALCEVNAVTALAQQVTGVLGSPSATTTLDGKQLPPPNLKFEGVIKEKPSESKAWWAPRVVPPKGAPNVLLIITNNTGFAPPATLAGAMPPPPRAL